MMMVRLQLFTMMVLFVVLPFLVHAQSTAELQKQIDENNAQIAALDKEIAQYQAQLDSTTAEKNTLQNKINQLDLQRKQLTAKISVTKNQINTTRAQIKQLAGGIASAESSIEYERHGLAESIRLLDMRESVPLALVILSSGSISDTWRDVDETASLQQAVRDDMRALSSHKRTLSDTKSAAEEKQTQLVHQQSTLTTQQGSLDVTRKAQNELLSETKSKESAYQALIDEKQEAKQDFENTLRDLQAKLQAADTSGVPTAGTSALVWPLKSVYVTQYFGDTAFARTAAYKGNGHNGIDLRASIGTPVYASLSGTVQETNLGAVKNCQYGKWVLIKHANGLTTLYAHLSQVSVVPGEAVSTGELIGYSGDTGYATGPHLHFTVYASSGVSFINYKCNSGKVVKVPVSPFNGYFNPMTYLPAI